MIIKQITSNKLQYDTALSGFFYPPQFVTDKQRGEKWYIKKMMDYFGSIGFSQIDRKKNMVKNYKLRNGEFDFKDYETSPELKQMDQLLGNVEENDYEYLRHYPMINPPLNTLKGELVGRPRKERVKADDEMSRSEILGHRTEALFQAVIQKLQGKFQPNEQGEYDPEYYKQLQEDLVNYSTEAENWGNKALKVFKSHFNFSEKNEDGFMDFLTSGEEFHHLYPDNSKFGFKYKVENPINVWYLGNANARYTSDCWAVGTLELMSISGILDEFKLDKDEVEQLTNKQISIDGNIMYTTQTPSLPDPNLLFWSMNYSLEQLADATMLNSMAFGNQQYHAVVKAYWKGKKKIFKRTYLDEEGYQREEYVDETYKMDKQYGDISMEEEWINQWYKSIRIGPYVYKEIEELEWNDTCPIVGIINHTKNTKGRSLVDLMKPYQAQFNVLMNQIWNLMGKEVGKVFLGTQQAIPKKDSDNPIETFLYEARERGAMFIDTSVDNAGSNVQFNQFTAIDLTRSLEIETRLKIADSLQNFCWELIGISRQRAGTVMASDTARGTDVALNQSYAQTEIWFKFHEDVMREVLQTALNIMQWTELKKPASTLNYLNSELDNVFFSINRAELLRNLNVNVTSAKEDKDLVDSLKQLMQPAMQNGADLVEMAEIMSANTENKLKDILAKIKEEKEKREQQIQEIEQQKLKQQQDQFEAQQKMLKDEHDAQVLNDNLNKQADRENKITIATINAIGFERNDTENTLDIETASKLAMEESKNAFDRIVKIRELSQEDKRLSLEDKNIQSKERIAKSRPKTSKKK